MAYRKYIAALIFCLSATMLRAQVAIVQQADSVSYALYTAANWPQLITYGKHALDQGIDPPLLRLRVAYAYFASGNFGEALAYYKKITAADPANQTARYLSYLCNKYLNRDAAASANAGYFGNDTSNPVKLNPFGLVDAGIESSFKMAGTSYRGNGSYTRASLSNRLGWRLQLEQSVAGYDQPIYYTIPLATVRDRANNTLVTTDEITSTDDRQYEYYAKLSYVLTGNLLLLGSYHHLSTSYQQVNYQNDIGLLGLKYSSSYFTLQADASLGYIIKNNVAQYDAILGVYPLGNLNLYAITKASLQQQNSSRLAIVNEAIGFKAFKNCWLEGSATFGKLDNYLDADGLYVYDAIDVTKFKAGGTIFYQLGGHAILQVNYTFEKKTDSDQALDYDQHSITAGLKWKF